jgi:hypothetical protein
MLGRWRVPEAKPLFMEHLDSGRGDQIAFTSIKALSFYGDEEAREMIEAMQSHGNKEIANFAKATLGKMGE